MKFGERDEIDLDSIDIQILALLQGNCKLPWGKIGDQVGLSAPSVIERVKKLEECGIITGYRAIIDGHALGLDITAFIGVIIDQPASMTVLEQRVADLADVLECHHVTGEYTLLLKVKTRNTGSLEDLIKQLRAIDGVARTETMVVLSTHTERVQVPLPQGEAATGRRSKRGQDKEPIPLQRA